MGSFQKIVLLCAVVILIISLLVIGIVLSVSKKKNWPPSVSACPDWWIVDGSGNRQKCINVKDLGVCKPQGNMPHQVMDFNTGPFSGSNGNCSKYTWANRCKVSWDGITYGVSNPCNSTSSSSSSSCSS
jgi:hypothetical protein